MGVVAAGYRERSGRWSYLASSFTVVLNATTFVWSGDVINDMYLRRSDEKLGCIVCRPCYPGIVVYGLETMDEGYRDG